MIKKILLGLVLLVMTVVSIINIGTVVVEDKEEIKEELNRLSDYADEKFDEAVEFIDNKVELVLKKD